LKLLRLLLTCLAVIVGVAILLVLVAVSPTVQTWEAQRQLSRMAGVKGTVGSVSAGFGEINIEDLHLEANGAVLTLPSFQAKLSLTSAVLDRNAQVHSIVANGWTLDLSKAAPGDASAPRNTALILGSLLKPWHLPVDLSVDDVEMEGDVILPAPGSASDHVHVRLTGGGMAGGREGTFTLDTSADALGPILSAVSARGSVAITMDSPRTFSRVRLTGGLSGFGGPSLGNLTFSAAVDVPRGGAAESFTVGVNRAGRALATFTTQLPTAEGRIAGTWAVNCLDTDIAPFYPDHPLPALVLKGGGQFDADAAFASVHALGKLEAAASRLGAFSPALVRVGNVTLAATFDATHSGQVLHVATAEVLVRGSRDVASVHALQAFDVDERSAAVKVQGPGGWIDVSIKALPLAWLPAVADGVSIGGGDVSGELTVTPVDGGVSLSSQGSLMAAGVTIKKADKILLHDLDVSADAHGDVTEAAWHVVAAPLVLTQAGHTVARLEAKAARTGGADQPVVVTGTWTGDVAALGSQLSATLPPGFSSGSASGDFTVTLTDSTEFAGKIAWTGIDPGNSIVASPHAEMDPGGASGFSIPIRIKTGATVSDFSAEGTWQKTPTEDQVDVKLTGTSAASEHLALLAGMFAPAGGDADAGHGRDAAPFWGDLTGHVALAFDHFKAEGGDLVIFGGNLTLDHSAIRLDGGHGGPAGHSLTNVAGVLTFDPSAAVPYSVKAAGAPFDVDSGPLFKEPHSGNDPMVEGKFSVAPSLVGGGANLGELEANLREEFKLTSSSGIIRFLRADVASSLHEKSAPMTDTLGTVGSAVGLVFGVDKKPDIGNKNALGKNTEAVLDLVNQVSEIGCDLITVVADRRLDGAIRIVNIDIDAPDEFLRGSGSVASAKGAAMFDQPLDITFELGARGKVAELLVAAGLATGQKDAHGFAVLTQSVHFGGTLAHIDGGQWQALLVKAANQSPKP